MRKKWYEKPLRKNAAIKRDMAAVCRMYGVNYRFKKYQNTGGYAWPNQNRIVVNTTCKSQRHFMCAVFHEISHVMNYVNGKYKNYHTIWNHHMTTNRKIEILRAIIQTGIHAEKYTDKLAERIFRMHYPDVPYKRAYRNASDRKWFKKWMTDQCKRDLKYFLKKKRKRK